MESQTFDALSRWIASRSQSRRTTLSLIAAGLLGVASSRFSDTSGEAAAGGCRAAGRRCRRGRQCCSGRCIGRKDRKRCRGWAKPGAQPRPTPSPPVPGICQQGESLCRDGSAAACGDGCSCFQAVSGVGFCGRFRRGAVCQQDADCVALGLPENAICARSDGPNCEIETATLCAVPCPAMEPVDPAPIPG